MNNTTQTSAKQYPPQAKPKLIKPPDPWAPAITPDTEQASQPLGTYTVTVDNDGNDVQRAQLKQDLLFAAKELLPHEKRLQACLSLRVDALDVVTVQYAANVEKARATNVCRCDNPHICPNCGPIIAERKRAQLQQDIAAWGLAGHIAVFTVLTLQHFQGEALATVDKRVDLAVKKLWDGRPGREFKARWGIVGRNRNPDLTHGENGWHSHRNLILYLDRGPLTPSEVKEFQDQLAQLWQAACQAVGGWADLTHGCKVKFDGISEAVDYIASKASGCGAGEKKQWGVAEEMTKHYLKQARYQGETPTQLLEAYLFGDQEAGQLWQEYAAVFKGKKFIDTSPGLRSRLDQLKEQYADQLATMTPEEERPEWSDLAYLGPAAWQQVVNLQILNWLLVEVKRSGGDAAYLRAWLQDWGITQVYYPTLDPEPPDWWYAPEGTAPEVIAGIKRFNQFMKEWNGAIRAERKDNLVLARQPELIPG